MTIPPTRLPSNTKYIPQGVDVVRSQADPESEPFKLSFRYYNDDLCEIDLLIKNVARTLLKDIRTIGKCTFKSLFSSGIDIIPVTPKGAYEDIFSTIPKDVDHVYEHKISGDSRLFFFCVQNNFNIVAILQNHLETRKHN